ncbi:MAG: glycosyltransferase [Parasphingorhabdus sp.]|nr:glycosyltransferase [Parasphingorhabdus sp.]
MLATLFPNSARPNFGIFVERQWAEIARSGGCDFTIVNPIGLPPGPLRRLSGYRDLAALPDEECWHGLAVNRPRFNIIPKFGGSRNPAAIVRAVLPLARRLHAERPFDAIHAEFLYPDAPAAMHLADALDIPFTAKARGADVHYWGKRRGCAAQLLAAGDAAAGLLAVSDALAEDLAALGIAREKIAVHYTGLDARKFHPRDRDRARSQLGLSASVILSVGALIPRKRHDLLIAALPRLPQATLLIAGTGPDQTKLEAQAVALGVAERVLFLGSLAHDDLPDLYRAADVFALVSSSEGLANVWVESLACGTPIVISNAGGAAELVRNATAGVMIAPTADAVARAISNYLEHHSDPVMVANAVADFSWDRNGQQLVAFFQNVIAR